MKALSRCRCTCQLNESVYYRYVLEQVDEGPVALSVHLSTSRVSLLQIRVSLLQIRWHGTWLSVHLLKDKGMRQRLLPVYYILVY